MIYTFRYVGNKFKYLDKICKLIFKCKDEYPTIDTLIELFGGSGCVSVNMSRYFKNVVLNDIDTQVINIHTSFKNGTYEDWIRFINKHDLFNTNLATDKPTYYTFRDNCNDLYFDKDDLNFGYASYFMVGACLNSICRFGPNGFNQSFGRRDLGRRMNQIKYNAFHNLYSNIELNTVSYEQLLNEYDSNNTLLFLDPPYSNMNDTYASNFNSFDKNKFIETIISLSSKIIYTDSYNQNEWSILKEHGWKRYYIRHITGVKPIKRTKEDTKHIEVIYTNF